MASPEVSLSAAVVGELPAAPLTTVLLELEMNRLDVSPAVRSSGRSGKLSSATRTGVHVVSPASGKSG